jgi:hypothetical protein
VQVRVVGDGLVGAAAHLVVRSELVRDQASSCARVSDGLRDPVLRAAVTALSEVAGDVLELVARDLILLSTRVRAGAVAYGDTENGVVQAMRT